MQDIGPRGQGLDSQVIVIYQPPHPQSKNHKQNNKVQQKQ